MLTPLTTIRNRACIGFIRVSTTKQKEDGLSLEQQIETIRRVVREHGGDLLRIPGDAATGMGADAHIRNPDLAEVLREALERRAVIVVTDITRLGRSDTLADVIRQFELDVFSADAGRILTYEELKRRLSSAKAFGEALRRRVKGGLLVARSKGRRLGNTRSLVDAQFSAAVARVDKANQLNEEIAGILSNVDPHNRLSAAEVATLLNGRGLRTARGNTWTKDRLRRHLRRASSGGVDWIQDESDDWSS